MSGRPGPVDAAAEAADRETARWASKVTQHRAVRSADPGAAFDIVVLDGPRDLAEYLGATDRIVVLRPELSAGSGSAVIRRPGDTPGAAELDPLWVDGGRVVAHGWVDGDSYFINGVMHRGRFLVTDAWRCFSQEERHRSLLTSVLYVPPGARVRADAAVLLSAVAAAAGLPEGPLHSELVWTATGSLKVVKFAPRIAGEPLPSLCRSLGIPGQTGIVAAVGSGRASAGGLAELLASEPAAFVADYSFLVRVSGHLVRIERLAELRSRPTYSADLRMPQPGDYLARSESGERPAATILLRGSSEAQMLADIAYYQARNAEGIFVVSR